MQRLIAIIWSLILVLTFGAPLAALAQGVAPIPHARIKRTEQSTQIIEETSNFAKPTDVFAPNAESRAALNALAAALNAKVEKAQNDAMPEQRLSLSAKISDEGAVIPSGIVWRVFDTKPDEKGNLPLLAKSDTATANFSLKPGDYVVHVAYGRSQATDTVHVDPTATTKTIVLDSGGLRLNAAISGDVPINPKLLGFEIYATEIESGDRILIANDVTMGDVIHLNAGVYNVVSKFGTVNAIVRADLRVDPGQLTDATLFHKAQQVRFRLASEPDGEAIADVDWVVKTGDGDTVFSSFGAFPSTILAEGEYSLLAKRGESVYNRRFEVKPGPSVEIELLTSIY